MDAGVVAGLRPKAFASQTAAERVGKAKRGTRSPLKLSAAGRNATAAAESRAGPSAASPLLGRVARHRLRRGSWHLAPRRSQRRSTPFFSNLLTDRLEAGAQFAGAGGVTQPP